VPEIWTLGSTHAHQSSAKDNYQAFGHLGRRAVVVASVASPTPWLFLGVGVALGACAGGIQLRSLRESSASLLTTQTAMDVRRVLSSSRTGQLYLNAFWGSMAVLFALAFYLLRGRAFVGVLAGYSAFAFARELLTLRGTFELHRLSTEQRV
jgi:hypothetical protein